MTVEKDLYVSEVSYARRFHLDLNPRRGTTLVVVAAGCEHCDSDYHNHRTTFPYVSVEYVAGGKGELSLGGEARQLQSGTVFSYGPGVEHTIISDASQPMVKYFVDFVGDRGIRLLQRASLAPGSVMQVTSPTQVMTSFDQLITEGAGESPFRPNACRALLEYLLIKIAETAVPYGTTETLALRTYQRCRQHIQRDYLSLHSLGDLATACSVDPAYLCRLFKRFGGLSPYQYLTQLKMKRAAELLQAPGSLVREVAEELGFVDPCQFSRVFKRVHGVSPGRFLRLSVRSSD